MNYKPIECRDLKGDIRNILAPMRRGETAAFELNGDRVIVKFGEDGYFDMNIRKIGDRCSSRMFRTKSLKEAVKFICW